MAILGAIATLTIVLLAGLRMGDRLIYHVHLEGGFSLAERRCQGFGGPDTPERHECLRAELAKKDEPLLKGTFPHFLAAVLTSVTTVGGLAIAFSTRKERRRHAFSASE
jgi:hypothetical protein